MPLSRFSTLMFSALLAVPGLDASAAPLTLAEVLQQAVQTHPLIAARSAQLDAARAAQTPAGELPDPRLGFGIDNYPVSGPSANRLTADSMTMQRIGISQEIPNAGKRRARRDIADARVDEREAEQRIARREVLRDTALAWIAQLKAEKKIAAFAELEAENRRLAASARARIGSGEARVDEAVLPQQQGLQLADQRDLLEAERRQAVAALRRWLGQSVEVAADTPWPAWSIARETLHARLHQHPELQIFAPRARELLAARREAEAARTPDWGVEVAYQRRGEAFGDMVSFGVSVDLPMFAARRQNPLIAERAAEQRSLDAERDALLRQHTEELERDLAEYQRLDRAMRRQRDALLPLLSHRLALLDAGYAARKTTLAEIVAARAERAAAQLQLIELEGQRSMAAARLHFTYGALGQ